MRFRVLLFIAGFFGIVVLAIPLVVFSEDTAGQDIVVGFTNSSFTTVHLSSKEQFSDFLQRYGSSPDIAYIEPEVRYAQAATPNDPYYHSQSFLTAVGAPTAWGTETGSSSIIVAVLDGGVDISHPDLSSHIWVNRTETANNHIDDDHNGYIDDRNGWDFVTGTSDVTPRSGSTLAAANHGTVIAGIIGAVGNNGVGVSGVTWDVRIMPLRVLGTDGTGISSHVARAVMYAADNGADIINLSFVGTSSSTVLMQAIQYARQRGAVVIAAAGNSNLDLNSFPRYPVCNNGVIGVASVSDSGVKSSFSNYGSSCIDVSAPGEDMFSTVSTESGSGFAAGYASGWNGTSFATPVVAGVAALAKSHQSDISENQLELSLQESVTSINAKNPSYSRELGGLISASKAVSSGAPTLEGATILTFPFYNGGPQLRWFTKDGTAYQDAFIADEAYRGTGSIAVCDIDGNGTNEILYGSGSGVESRVHLISHEGVDVWSYQAFSSPQNGIRIACGDTNGDGADDVIAIREAGSASEIRIFDAQGNIRKRFFAWDNSFLGGMDIAAADINNDGKAEIITGMGPTGLPRVQAFTEDGDRVLNFYAYGLGYRGGVNVAVGDVDGDGYNEIITAPKFHGGPDVHIYSKRGFLKKRFFAYGEGFHGGVNISTADIDGDGIDDIITGAGRGGGPHVRAFHGYGDLAGIASFFAYGSGFGGGVQVQGFTPLK